MADATDSRNIFVVHGRNLEARNSLFRFLRSIGLRPLEWSQAIQFTGKVSPFIGEILDVAFSTAQAVVVLMTPDDVAQLQEPFRSPHDPSYESQLTGQARPNVLFEAGMAMGRNPERTILVELGALRPFSDIAGRHTVRLNNDSATRQELAQRLETAGCAVDLSGRDWHTEGDFNPQSASAQKGSTEPNPQIKPLEATSIRKTVRRIAYLQQPAPEDLTVDNWTITYTVDADGDGRTYEELTILPNLAPIFFFFKHYSLAKGSDRQAIKISALTLPEKSELTVLELDRSDGELRCAIILDPPSTVESPQRIAIDCTRTAIWGDLVKEGVDEGSFKLYHPATSLNVEFQAPVGRQWKMFTPSPATGDVQIEPSGSVSRVTWSIAEPSRRRYDYKLRLE